MTKLYVIFFSILYTLSFSQERVDDFKEVLILEEGFELQTNVNITKYKYSEILGTWSKENKWQSYKVLKLDADTNSILITKKGHNALQMFVDYVQWLSFKKSFKLGLKQNTIELKTPLLGGDISLSHRSISLCTYKKLFGKCHYTRVLHYYQYGDIIRFNIISESKYDSYYKNKEFLKEYIEVSKDDFEKFLN